MKKSFILSGLVFLSMTGIAHAAKSTDLKLAVAAIELMGSAPQGTKISAIAVYSPDKAANANMAACEFEEDKYSPNGATVMSLIQATQNAQGGYSLKLPLTGTRKNCKYAFSQAYFAIEKNGTLENLSLLSDAKVAEENALEAELDIDKSVYQDFENQKEIYCDFVSDVGICHINGNLSELAYHISTSEHQVQFDIKNEGEQAQ